ncbi:putative map kinase protein [Neofusicoccum parvum UCRNP2]|uniref:mitogen-activated protein kinase n=1 Tax=Botryosphaeria parva (strain UCR-NP2) TaxID=1287680 RepID=R1GKB0_BOTPV|nr:putative map kinase protein [Neofusicoccum parvum UCRNP2]
MSSIEPTHRGVRFTEPAHGKSQHSVADDKTSQTAPADAAMDAPVLPRNDSSTSGSGSSGDSDPDRAVGERNGSDDDIDGQYQFAPAVSTTPRDEVPPMAASAGYAYTSRARGGSGGAPNGVYDGVPTAQLQAPGMNSSRPPRPTAVRTPSNAYAPQRRPQQYSLNSNSGRHRASSTNRSRRNPNADYRAQERAYVERIRQDAPDNDDFFNPDLRTPSLGYSTEDSGSDDESPSTTDYLDNDPYDQETLLYYGNDDLEPSMEELKIPENRERLEWHSMLASVLTGDVVKQEKKRLIGGGEQQGDNTIKTEIWMGVRAKCCGRTLQAQRRLIEDGRSKAKTLIEGIITFEIKGEAEVGLTAAQQVADMVQKIEKCEGLYPTWQALEQAQPRAASAAFRESCDAVISWYNTTQLINTELSILRSWVGNEELDFSKRKNLLERDSHLTDDSSFIDRILKEDGLKSLQSKDSLLVGLNNVINKAKATLIANASAFSERHLPPYIEELLTLINFPSRLVQEIIRMRLSYAKRMKDPAQQGVMMAEQMISQFQILLKLAIRIKESYTIVSQPEAGWDPPPCIEENFDVVVLETLKFYFKMLNWKLSANKNTFKEAEILEQEWEFSKSLGKHLEGGDVEVAEQFSYLTQKSLSRLTAHFEKELQRRPEEVAGAEMDKRYKQILDSVRVRQRKLFRFSRILTTRANATFTQVANVELTKIVDQRANLPRVNVELQRIKKVAYKLSNTIMDSVEIIRKQTTGLECQELIQTCFAFATEFGQRSVYYMDFNRRALNNLKLTRLALDWVSFICDDCVASDRKTFRWAVVALEFAMMMTRGQNILSLNEEEYTRLRAKVAGCMSLLISHFDIMGARSTMAAQAEKQRIDAMLGKKQLDISRLKNDEESAELVREGWLEQLVEIDEMRKTKEAERQALGRVLEDSNEADRALTYLSSSATNVTLRWQQGQFIGGGTFGSVYAAINLDSNHLMAVKEIRLQDPQLIPTIVSQIRDEMGVLQMLDHPNIVSYYGIEPHRDKVYIFMEYCSGGSLAGLLEHGRIEDETVIMVYALQMLEGLAYLHESSVVHRDVKPENILLDHNGVIKFVDFGAAKVIAKQGKTLAAEHAATRQGRQKSMTGTPMYMSPEVIKGENKGRLGAVDIWSLGCVILEMATGRRPWASLDNEWAIMYNIAQGNPPQLPTGDQLSDSGIDFLNACFERDPGKRATAAELLQHEWIMILRSQLSLEPQTPQTPLSETSSGSGSLHPSRHNTMQ